MAAEETIQVLQEMDENVDIPGIIPILPLRNTVVFPRMAVPLSVGRESSKELVQDAVNERKIIGLVTQKQAEQDEPGFQDLYSIGTAARIIKLLRIPDGTLNIIIQGIKRFRLLEPAATDPYLTARIELLEVVDPSDSEMEALFRNVKEQASRMVDLSPHIPQEAQIIIQNVDDPMVLIDMVVGNLNLPASEKQAILEILDMKRAMAAVLKVLGREGEVLEMSSRIQDEVKSSINKTQREYFLRQQLKAIRKELGEDEEPKAELDELKERLDKAGMSAEVAKEATKEFNRMKAMPEAAAEYSVIRTYLDWMAELPWSKRTRDKLDIAKARAILDKDHHDLEKVKKRILEYLAVRKLVKEPKGPILCFVGPPGVGKTSLGRSIARSLGRKFIRMSLGGIHDEAEIRGHRRTYVGALPGRIIQGMRKVESNNPVFMLDEVDKVGADFRGDPSSALLEVLDPEQNFSFADNYLGVPFDLSKVLFIATANTLQVTLRRRSWLSPENTCCPGKLQPTASKSGRELSPIRRLRR
jgi:ATP-dependent Lon protease